MKQKILMEAKQAELDTDVSEKKKNSKQFP